MEPPILYNTCVETKQEFIVSFQSGPSLKKVFYNQSENRLDIVLKHNTDFRKYEVVYQIPLPKNSAIVDPFNINFLNQNNGTVSVVIPKIHSNPGFCRRIALSQRIS